MDSLDTHLGHDKLTLEGFTLTFASPYAQNKWNLWDKKKQAFKDQ